jgi:hypothetical protein
MNALKHALLGTDWYLNTQVVNQKPWWDNNHGRFIYTRHMPTGMTVRGICWTQARGIMCCLSAYERTRRKKYLEAAERAAQYLFNLQILDARDTRFFGAFHEEIFCSVNSNVRDASESMDALTMLYRVTKNKEYLFHAEIWAQWYIKNGQGKGGFPLGHFNLMTGKRSESDHSFSGAIAMSFYHLFLATRKPLYKAVFKRITEVFIRKFIRKRDNAILSGGFASHHAAKGSEKGIALNDDGSGVHLLMAYKLLKDKKYLEIAKDYGDYILKQRLPYEIYSAHPGRFNYLLELSFMTGDRKYADHVKKNIHYLLKLQYLNPKQPMHHGAFRGEDEPTKWYGPKGAKGMEFVNNRMTAYAVMTLFKMDGKVKGPAYSALGW